MVVARALEALLPEAERGLRAQGAAIAFPGDQRHTQSKEEENPTFQAPDWGGDRDGTWL